MQVGQVANIARLEIVTDVQTRRMVGRIGVHGFHSADCAVTPVPHCIEKSATLIPHAEIQFSQGMQSPRCLEIQPGSDTPAIGRPAQRWRPIVNAAFVAIQVYAIAVRLVSKHQRAADIRVLFRQIVLSEISFLKSDGVTLTAQGASIAGNVFS